MTSGVGQATPTQLATEHVDDTLDRQVLEYSKLYDIQQWLQPRSMVQVQLAKLKEETKCPMCFGKIRSARISMVCLHRYCAKCIEQYLRAKMPGRHGDEKECPVCRAHLHSRRATKPDPAFDKIIKALYGDVDQFDAEEEALIEADNKAHIQALQARMADMRARQEAAVAAAKAGGPVAASGPQASGARGPGSGLARPGSTRHLDGMAAETWSGGAANARPSKKRPAAPPRSSRGWNGDDDSDDEEQQGYRDSYAAAAATSKGGSKAARLMPSSRDAAGASGGKRGAAAWADGAAFDGAEAGRTRGSPPSASTAVTAAALGPGPSEKKRIGAKQLLGMAAHAAAAAGPPPRCCVVTLMPEQQGQQQQGQGEPAQLPPAAAAGRSEGRSRKQNKTSTANGSGKSAAEQQPLRQLLPGQVVAPSIARPFLACPLSCNVAQLKQLVLQQLEQQGTTTAVQGSFELQMRLGQQLGLMGRWGSSSSDCSGEVLADTVTVAQLHDQAGCLGPGLQLRYCLVGV